MFGLLRQVSHMTLMPRAGELGQLQSEAAGSGSAARRSEMLTSLAAPGVARSAHGDRLNSQPCTYLSITCVQVAL